MIASTFADRRRVATPALFLTAGLLVASTGCLLPGRDALTGEVSSFHNLAHTIEVVGFVIPGETDTRGHEEDWTFNASNAFYERSVELSPAHPDGRMASVSLGVLADEPGRYMFEVTLDGNETTQVRSYWSTRTGPDQFWASVGSDGTLHAGFLTT